MQRNSTAHAASERAIAAVKSPDRQRKTRCDHFHLKTPFDGSEAVHTGIVIELGFNISITRWHREPPATDIDRLLGANCLFAGQRIFFESPDHFACQPDIEEVARLTAANRPTI